MKDALPQYLAGLALAACCALAGILWDSKAKDALQEERIANLQSVVEELRNDKKFWKLHAWSRDEINAIRHKLNLEPARWPDDLGN